MEIVITNKGQLEFALEKPKLNIRGVDMYPELYQKAAVLMETIAKTHALSDGNKRTAMLIAQTMVTANGGRLILPLKSIRLSVNTAMDANDEMSELIQQWFKTHIAIDACQSCSMLTELHEEEGVIKTMLKQGREDDANILLDRWMAFDSYPDNRQACGDLIEKWRYTMNVNAERKKIQSANWWSQEWASLMRLKNLSHTEHDYHADHDGNEHHLKYNYNNMDELLRAEIYIQTESDVCRETTDISLMYQNALTLERYGMYDYSIAMFERIFRVHKDAHALMHVAMNVQYKLDDVESAVKYWSMYLKHEPDDSFAHISMGLAFMELGKHLDALAYFEKVPQDYERINMYMGQVYANMCEYDKALELYMKEIETNPDNDDVHGFMGILYNTIENREKALECFDNAIKINPSRNGYYNKGTVLADLGRYEESIACYKNILILNPNDLEPRINLAAVLSDSGKSEDAIQHFYHALDIDPTHPIALDGIVLTLARAERYDEALGYAEKITKLNHSNVKIKYMIASILAQTNNINKCLDMLETLANTDPKFIESINSSISKSMFDPILNNERFKRITYKRC